ncbi:MAG: LacI family DNA-binding transcriptional regulator [Armatimonadetes bacterium]|nr:LacI family DNA-binding transcriptional regulator [Armatimonadota bacterium]
MVTVSIREVAQKAGVPRSTVSRALNREAESLINPKTRARVRLASQELGYMPSMVARGLARKRMNTLGIVMTLGVSSPNTSLHYAPLFDAVVQACRTYHQNVTLYVGEEWENRETSLPYFRDGRCDGFVYLSFGAKGN